MEIDVSTTNQNGPIEADLYTEGGLCFEKQNVNSEKKKQIKHNVKSLKLHNKRIQRVPREDPPPVATHRLWLVY
jgi:hypothetical protein